MPKRIRGARAPGPFRFTVGGQPVQGTFWNGDGGGTKFKTGTEVIIVGLQMVDLNGAPELCCVVRVRPKRGTRKNGETAKGVRITPIAKLTSTIVLPIRPPTGRNA
ncbi:hypothetical protein HYZ80_01750 [Candidatus Parcubacteria bacterium]|nr:hypothetical protein [Candidatus Parcubacteria bacterium]